MYREEFCEQVLVDYLELLDEWEVRYAPRSSDEEPHERYTEAVIMIVCVEYMLDKIQFGTDEECQEVVDRLMEENRAEILREWIDMIWEEGIGV